MTLRIAHEGTLSRHCRQTGIDRTDVELKVTRDGLNPQAVLKPVVLGVAIGILTWRRSVRPGNVDFHASGRTDGPRYRICSCVASVRLKGRQRPPDPCRDWGFRLFCAYRVCFSYFSPVSLPLCNVRNRQIGQSVGLMIVVFRYVSKLQVKSCPAAVGARCACTARRPNSPNSHFPEHAAHTWTRILSST